MKDDHFRHFFAALIGACAVAAISAASAQSTSSDDHFAQPKASRSNVDMRFACEAFDDQMQSVLAPVMRDREILGDVFVQFNLERGRVFNVHTEQGPFVYRRAIKRALHRLNCDAGDEVSHAVSLVIHFVGWRGTEEVAVIDVLGTAQR